MNLRYGLAALAALGFCAPAMAQVTSDVLLKEAANCFNEEVTLDVRIAACTVVLKDPSTKGDDRADTLFARASGYADKKDYPAAISDFGEAIKLDPTWADLWFSRGVVHGYMEKFQEAIADYNEAIRLDPKHGDALGNRGNMYQYGLDDYDKAIADYTAAIAIRPHALEYGNRGGAYFYGKNDLVKALADLDKALELDPKSSTFYGIRCFARASEGVDLDKAVADCTTSIGIQSADIPLIYSARAIAYYKQKKFQDAWNDFDAALKQMPGDGEFLYGRGLAAAKLGRADAAKADMDAGVKAMSDVKGVYEDYGITG